MELIQDRDKRTGLIVTVVFHVLVLILFMFIGLTQPDPLPEPEGAMIELGWTDSGSGDTESQVVSEVDQIEEVAPTETVQEESVVEEEEVVTQEESPVSTPESTQETVQESTPEPEPDPQPSQELQDAMSNVFNTPTGSGSEGEDEDGPGNTGSPDGSPAGKGVMGGSGNSWELAGRGYEGGAVVTEKPKEEGKVVLNIWVGRDGRVTRTSLNLGASNTTSQHLVSLAEKAAKKARFNADPASAVEQKGKMTFIFKLQ
ncbi:MAG: TonB family protein [Flavobacteriales bacterium]|nr:TonB family protein [Flavobacteriales bacterium]